MHFISLLICIVVIIPVYADDKKTQTENELKLMIRTFLLRYVDKFIYFKKYWTTALKDSFRFTEENFIFNKF